MERSKLRFERGAGLRSFGLAAWFVFVLGAGCAYPEYTYVEGVDDAGGSGGTAGTAGTGGVAGSAGTGGTGGTSGTGGLDAGDAEADAPAEGDAPGEADVSAEADAPDEADVSVEGDAPSEADVSVEGDAPSEADAPAEADAPVEVGPETGGDCPGVTEVCNNGIDDDCDGLTDCQDTSCTSYTCTNIPPAGWQGYFAVYEGSPSSVPGCPGTFPSPDIVVGRDPAFQAASCTSCGCGSASGVQCGEPIVNVYEDTTCSSSSGWFGVGVTPHGDCIGWNLVAGDAGSATPRSVELVTPGPLAGTGSCAATGGAPSTNPPTWGTLGVACGAGAVGAGCSANSVCVPKPPAGFKVGVCIHRNGDQTCPTPYITKSLLYGSFNDTRSCQACSCNPPVGSTCSGTLTVATQPLSSSQCPTSGANHEVTMTQTGCSASINPVVTHFFEYNPNPPLGGSCAPTGGTPTGTVGPDPSTAVTVCCRPF